MSSNCYFCLILANSTKELEILAANCSLGLSGDGEKSWKGKGKNQGKSGLMETTPWLSAKEE